MVQHPGQRPSARAGGVMSQAPLATEPCFCSCEEAQWVSFCQQDLWKLVYEMH